MNKNLLKIGALALGMFAFGLMLNANAEELGEVSLTINSGESVCIYGTSLDLGAQNVQFDTAYEFSGNFGTWSCTDYIGVTEGWVLDIASSDLTNGLGNTISGANVQIMHETPIASGDVNCTGGDSTTWTTIGTTNVVIERSPGTDGVCSVSVGALDLKVDVPANQAPGAYTGTLTLTVPSF
ncbi:MAG: hypothetical protein PHR61_03450 [Candidatus Absconditabacteria bacterium]|nr:hypothetical protein [Candidatus Absconditabacteria bacterium]